MAFQYRIVNLFDLCIAAALAASFYGNASLVKFLVVHGLLGAYLGCRQANPKLALVRGLLASLVLTAMIGVVVETHLLGQAIAQNRIDGYPIFEDGIVVELFLVLPISFAIYGSIGAFVAAAAAIVGQKLRGFVDNAVGQSASS